MQDNKSESEEESSSEGAALEAAAALAAVSALVEGLKAFLSPHLSALLNLLFSPPVLACKQAGCSESAGSIRIQLAGVMPPRLLLAPLFAHFEGAVKVRSPIALCCCCRHILGMFPVAFKQYWFVGVTVASETLCTARCFTCLIIACRMVWGAACLAPMCSLSKPLRVATHAYSKLANQCRVPFVRDM